MATVSFYLFPVVFFRSVFLFFQVLAAVRAGLLAVAATPDQQPLQPKSGRGAVAEDVPPLPVGANGHADILREASHYLSAIKVRSRKFFVLCFNPSAGG